MKEVDGGGWWSCSGSLQSPTEDSEAVKMYLPQTMHGGTEGFLNVDPLNIFACWCTYPSQSFYLKRLINPKAFLWMLSTGQILMSYEISALVLSNKKSVYECDCVQNHVTRLLFFDFPHLLSTIY